MRYMYERFTIIFMAIEPPTPVYFLSPIYWLYWLIDRSGLKALAWLSSKAVAACTKIYKPCFFYKCN